MAAALVAACAASIPAQAQTTVTPNEAGPIPLVRDSAVTIKVDVSAMHYSRGTATANYTQASAATVAGSGCKGDNPAGVDLSPRTIVTVKNPNNAVVLTTTSPVRDLSFAGLFGNPQSPPLSPQPAPSDTNYRGDFSGSGASHGFSAQLNLAGQPAGTYTVTTTDINTYRTKPLFGAATPCIVGTPVASGTGFGNTAVAGPKVTTTTFEYRPWAATFKDVFGKGSVSANIVPAEFKFTLDGTTSPIFTGPPAPGTGGATQFYALPGGFALPSDPAACVADPASCLPASAVQCVPSNGCTPRAMLINRPANVVGATGLVGVFDLSTKAFVAHATIGGKKRVLMSLGTANDAYYASVLNQLATGAAAKGIDLPTILATQVNVTTGGQRTSLSLLNGLQIDPSTAAGGVQIASNASVQAGIVLNIYSSLRLDGGVCLTQSASSSTAPARFTRSAPDGYTVTKSDLLPAVPSVGPLGALVGGPIYHITGKAGTGVLVNTSAAIIGVDTAANEPNGYPVWVSPFLSGVHTVEPKTFDFLGTGTWSASEKPVVNGCLVIDFLLGAGVMVYNNPLPVGLGTIFDPLTTPSPAAEQLTDAVNSAITDAVLPVASNPAVDSLLGQLTGLLNP
ncbi:hypothetical protein ASD81_20625 [Nocardioides sp. Root614]|nr:hypothetical protein ASD81_20625 [Nocardioides sp. Root614]KRA85590.1 hypothetical protein ASD84_24385 [Nocardioides sp. Root682]